MLTESCGEHRAFCSSVAGLGASRVLCGSKSFRLKNMRHRPPFLDQPTTLGHLFQMDSLKPPHSVSSRNIPPLANTISPLNQLLVFQDVNCRQPHHRTRAAAWGRAFRLLGLNMGNCVEKSARDSSIGRSGFHPNGLGTAAVGLETQPTVPPLPRLIEKSLRRNLPH
jgi:hypothetical protein